MYWSRAFFEGRHRRLFGWRGFKEPDHPLPQFVGRLRVGGRLPGHPGDQHFALAADQRAGKIARTEQVRIRVLPPLGLLRMVDHVLPFGLGEKADALGGQIQCVSLAGMERKPVFPGGVTDRGKCSSGPA